MFMESDAFIRYCSSFWEKIGKVQAIPLRWFASFIERITQSALTKSSDWLQLCHWSLLQFLCILILLKLCIQPLDEPVRTTQALMQSLQTEPSSNHPSSQVITNVNQGSDKTSSWIMNSSITSAKYIVVNKVLWSACSYRAVPFVGGTNVQ